MASVVLSVLVYIRSSEISVFPSYGRAPDSPYQITRKQNAHAGRGAGAGAYLFTSLFLFFFNLSSARPFQRFSQLHRLQICVLMRAVPQTSLTAREARADPETPHLSPLSVKVYNGA